MKNVELPNMKKTSDFQRLFNVELDDDETPYGGMK